LAAFVVVGTLVGEGGGGTAGSPTQTSRGGGTTTTAAGSVVDIDTSAELLSSDGLRPLGAGTGMVLTSDGEILTNNHVVAGASEINVAIPDQRTETATAVGVDPTDDGALPPLNAVYGLNTPTSGDSAPG